MKTVRPVHASNGGPLPPNYVCRIAQHIREGEDKEKGKDRFFLIFFFCVQSIEEIGINAGNWVDSAQYKNYWRALMNAALNFRVP